MKLYLMRHCHATDGPRMDASRKLTALGKRQAKTVAKFFQQAGIKFDLVVSSPFQRATQTVKGVLGRKPDYEMPELEPDGTPEQAWKAIRQHLESDDDHVLVVTHSPLVDQLLASTCFAFSAGFKIFHHGAVVHIDRTPDDDQPGFRWWVAPHLLQKLEESAAVDDFADGCLILAENLMRIGRRETVAPAIAKLKTAVAQRFRNQWKQFKVNYKATGSLRLSAGVLKTTDLRLSAVLDKVASTVYEAGARLAQKQLPSPREADPITLPELDGPDIDVDTLEDGLDTTSEDRISEIITAGTLAGLSAAAILQQIGQAFQDWYDQRAETIAAGVVSELYHSGMADYAAWWRGGNGPVEKVWDVQDDPCEACQANADMGPIDSEAPFDSGDFEPPLHPNCRCSISYQASAAVEA